MTKEHRIKEFHAMYKRLMDPEERRKARREHEREARQEEKKSDTGL